MWKKENAPKSLLGFAFFVLYRGAAQFGLLAAFIFVFLSALRSGGELAEQAIRSIVVFPIIGAALGLVLWLFACRRRANSSDKS